VDENELAIFCRDAWPMHATGLDHARKEGAEHPLEHGTAVHVPLRMPVPMPSFVARQWHHRNEPLAEGVTHLDDLLLEIILVVHLILPVVVVAPEVVAGFALCGSQRPETEGQGWRLGSGSGAGASHLVGHPMNFSDGVMCRRVLWVGFG